MALIKIETIFTIDLEFETAPVYKRVIAYFIDFAILVTYFISMKNLYYGGVSYDQNFIESNRGLDILSISLPMLLYSPFMEVLMHGQTIGKKLMKIRIISLDGGEPSLSQYLVRWMFKVFEWPFFFGYVFFTGEILFAYIITTLTFGAFVAVTVAVTAKSQRLGDLAANTVVVNTQSSYGVEDTVFMDIKDENYQVNFHQVLQLSDRDINTIKNVIISAEEQRKFEMAHRVAEKVQSVLKIETDLDALPFLRKVLSDYNFLASK